MDIELIKRSIRLDRQRLQDTSSDLLIQKNIGKTAVVGRSRAIKERINRKFMELEKELVSLTKKWFIDRDLEHGGRLDKQALKLSEEFGELCAGYLKQNEKLAKDSIGDCAVVIVGLALLIKDDVHGIFEESDNIRRKDAMECFKLLNANISEFQLSQDLASKEMSIFSPVLGLTATRSRKRRSIRLNLKISKVVHDILNTMGLLKNGILV